MGQHLQQGPIHGEILEFFHPLRVVPHEVVLLGGIDPPSLVVGHIDDLEPRNDGRSKLVVGVGCSNNVGLAFCFGDNFSSYATRVDPAMDGPKHPPCHHLLDLGLAGSISLAGVLLSKLVHHLEETVFRLVRRLCVLRLV